MKTTEFNLYVELRDIQPKIWRRVVVSGDFLLTDFHYVIQSLFGWQDSHLWQFTFGKKIYTLLDDNGDSYLPKGMTQHDADDATLQASLGSGRKFLYNYDFGDNWQVDLVVEGRVEVPKVYVPRCTDGQRAGPPDDCGGVPGYGNLCEAMADPAHPEYADMHDWIGDDWDAEAFDLKDVNRCLKTGFAGLKSPPA